MGHNFSRGDGTWSVWESTFPGFIGIELGAKQFPFTHLLEVWGYVC